MTWRNEEFLAKIACPILVVGAGGIGCELLKNLALTGFSNIEVIDLDTIVISNLNRQFLFRREHVGKSKALTAAEAVRMIAPGVSIISHHDSVLDPKYDVDFFQRFKVVLGALDNVSARYHVNRMCLAARVPFIDSGSSGYLGHVCTVLRGQTECYECKPKPPQKTYPGCTIRNTPSEPIHCIVWAKHLFNQLFGEPDIDDDVSPDFTDKENTSESNGNNQGVESGAYKILVGENAENSSKNEQNSDSETIKNGKKIDDENNSINKKINMRQWAVMNGYDAKILFQKFFNDDIKDLLTMTNLWKQRRKPHPLEWDNLPNENASSSHDEPNPELWTILQCRCEFEKCMNELSDRVKSGQLLSWDKDDEPAMGFVAACANIRAHVFNIPTKTLFDIKSMAGNIIPAVATTNATVAGLIVVGALKIVSEVTSSSCNIFLRQKPNPRGEILVREPTNKPNPDCYVCSEHREIVVKTNIKLSTVGSLEAKFLKSMVHMIAPDVFICGSGKIVVSSEEGETDAIKHQPLEKVGVTHGSILECDDFLQKLVLRICIRHDDHLDTEEYEIETDSDHKTQNGAPDITPIGSKRPLSDEPESSPSKISRNGDQIKA